MDSRPPLGPLAEGATGNAGVEERKRRVGTPGGSERHAAGVFLPVGSCLNVLLRGAWSRQRRPKLLPQRPLRRRRPMHAPRRATTRRHRQTAAGRARDARRWRNRCPIHSCSLSSGFYRPAPPPRGRALRRQRTAAAGPRLRHCLASSVQLRPLSPWRRSPQGPPPRLMPHRSQPHGPALAGCRRTGKSPRERTSWRGRRPPQGLPRWQRLHQ